MISLPRAWVQSSFRELRSDKLQGEAKTEIAILEGELYLPVGFNLHFPDN